MANPWLAAERTSGWRRPSTTHDAVLVAARPSRESYETFGETIADELVNRFNQMGATYR